MIIEGINLKPTVEQIREAFGYEIANIPDEVIESCINEIDIENIYQTERNKYTVEIWDRVKPINGVEAQVVLNSRKDIPENSEIYLIKDQTGKVIFFQPHLPESEGLQPIPIGEGETVGNKHADKLAAMDALEIILHLIKEKLKNPTA